MKKPPAARLSFSRDTIPATATAYPANGDSSNKAIYALAYNSSKAVLNMLTLTLSKELLDTNIKFNSASCRDYSKTCHSR